MQHCQVLLLLLGAMRKGVQVTMLVIVVIDLMATTEFNVSTAIISCKLLFDIRLVYYHPIKQSIHRHLNVTLPLSYYVVCVLHFNRFVDNESKSESTLISLWQIDRTFVPTDTPVPVHEFVISIVFPMPSTNKYTDMNFIFTYLDLYSLSPGTTRVPRVPSQGSPSNQRTANQQHK